MRTKTFAFLLALGAAACGSSTESTPSCSPAGSWAQTLTVVSSGTTCTGAVDKHVTATYAISGSAVTQPGSPQCTGTLTGCEMSVTCGNSSGSTTLQLSFTATEAHGTGTSADAAASCTVAYEVSATKS